MMDKEAWLIPSYKKADTRQVLLPAGVSAFSAYERAPNHSTLKYKPLVFSGSEAPVLSKDNNS